MRFTAGRLSGVRNFHVQLQAQGTDHLHDGAELRVALGGQGLIQTFARQAGFTGKLARASAVAISTTSSPGWVLIPAFRATGFQEFRLFGARFWC